MARQSQDSPHTLITLEMCNSPQPEEAPFHPEIPYALVNHLRRITRAYTRQTVALSLDPILPQRKK
jgi:hypothetical protein